MISERLDIYLTVNYKKISNFTMDFFLQKLSTTFIYYHILLSMTNFIKEYNKWPIVRQEKTILSSVLNIIFIHKFCIVS